VRTYVDPRRLSCGLYLPEPPDFRDNRQRMRSTFARDVWRQEAPWMTLSFSIGVWTSLALVLLEGTALAG
jgi:hypothetical protein